MDNPKLFFCLGGVLLGLILLAQFWPYLVAALALIGAGGVYDQMKKR